MQDIISLLFSEELGLAIEYLPEKESDISEILNNDSIPFEIIGCTTDAKKISISINGDNVLDEDMRDLRSIWEETSYQLEKLQANPECAEEERQHIHDRPGPDYRLSFDPLATPAVLLTASNKPKVAIIREEGSNSDREMTGAFYSAGFEPWDISMTDFLEDRVSLANFTGMAFVGGFSYADVLDSAKGWAGVIRFNNKVWDAFQTFYSREDTFSLGVCNGCQLMALLGWVPWRGIEDAVQPRFIHNSSGRFESRFSSVKILESPSIMLSGMENSTLGIWVAHGEGRAYFPDESVLEKIEKETLAPVRYIDDSNEITLKYPFNPNGSAKGIAGLCSPDGRHLALMPHPERTFLTWQWPWIPETLKTDHKASPWLKMFQNAREWAENS
jgi:phosphoribosylformylglycinamidine synthase